MDISLENIYKDLQEKFYVHVPFPLGSFVIEDAIQAFLKFLNEPEEIKNHIDFSLSTVHRRGDVGFKHRNPNEHIDNDSKDFFHFHPALFEKHSSFLEKNPIVHDFVLKALPIWELAYKTTEDILRSFEGKFPGIYEKVFGKKDLHLLLRFLRYSWPHSGKYLAKPHFDAGSFTLAISESCPGLRIGSCPDDLQLVESKMGEAIFFLSGNLKKIMDTDELAAGWHDVIQVDETLIGKPFARWAIVAFIDGYNVETLSWSETHKWRLESAL